MCGCCGCRLGEVGSTLYTKANMILCKKDYFRYLYCEHVVHCTMLLLIDRFYRMFGNKGMCAACFKDIPAFEMVMRARSNVYHLECFACQQCNHRYYYVLYMYIIYYYRLRENPRMRKRVRISLKFGRYVGSIVQTRA